MPYGSTHRVNRRLIDDHVSDAHIRTRTRRYLPGVVIYTAALPLALVSPWITLWVRLGLGILYLLPVDD